MASGADGAVTSAHKLLSGLSQGALLNVRGTRVDADRVGTAVHMGQTTSPLLPILASLDGCRRQMALGGEAMLGRTIALATSARRRLDALVGLAVLDADKLGLPSSRYDVTRLVVDVRGLGMTGFEVEATLRGRFSVAPEMSDLSGVVCLVTIGDSAATVDRLVGAFEVLADERTPWTRVRSHSHRSAGCVIAPGHQALTPREAFFARSLAVPLWQATGEVCAELVVPYPPGIPVLAPGEVISEEKVSYLAQVATRGAAIRGAADASLSTVRVIDPGPGPTEAPRRILRSVALESR